MYVSTDIHTAKLHMHVCKPYNCRASKQPILLIKIIDIGSYSYIRTYQHKLNMQI